MKTLTNSLLVALSLPAAADILTLQDGSKIDATILKKTSQEYHLQVNVTKSIKEPRTIKVSEVVSVERIDPADDIFEDKIAKLVPAPPFLSLAEYDYRIKTIQDFLTAHKLSSQGTKATKMLATLEAERAVIAEGGVKITQEAAGLMSSAEREKDALGIDSHVAAQKFKNLIGKRSYIAAIRQYNTLEQDFIGSEAHRQSLPLMDRLINSYIQILDKELGGMDRREKELMVTLDQLDSRSKRRMMEAEESRMEQLKTIWEMEEKEDQAWFTVDPKDGDSLKNTIKALEKEEKRISKIKDKIAEKAETAQLYREGWVAAGEKNKKELDTILNTMERAGASEHYLNKLIDRFDSTINNPPAEESPSPDETEITE